MADYTRSETHHKTIRYELRSPTNLVEMDKARAGIYRDFRETHDGRNPEWDDEITVSAEDDLVVLSFSMTVSSDPGEFVASFSTPGEPPYQSGERLTQAQGPWCEDAHEMFICTLVSGHGGGWHISVNSKDFVNDVWPVEPSDPSEKVQS